MTTEKTRLTLHEALVDFLGSSNVYYQPPESTKIKYPCVLYEKSRINQMYANNHTYIKNKQYTITIVYRDADSTLPDDILNAFEFISYDRSYKADNLYHEVFTIIW